MKHINVPVSDETYAGAKMGAARDGMLFRKWVERAIVSACVDGDLRPMEPDSETEVAIPAGVWVAAEPAPPLEPERAATTAIPLVEDEQHGRMSPKLAAFMKASGKSEKPLPVSERMKQLRNF